ncbi:MAG: hypothetical protein K1X83_06535 [Oligoflexia bacterium]|nr:hypothetical protein [Oligoflexia bacterium]
MGTGPQSHDSRQSPDAPDARLPAQAPQDSVEFLIHSLAAALVMEARHALAQEPRRLRDQEKVGYCRGFFNALTAERIHDLEGLEKPLARFEQILGAPLEDETALGLRKALLELFEKITHSPLGEEGCEFALDSMSLAFSVSRGALLAASLPQSEVTLCCLKISGGILGTIHEEITRLRIASRESQLAFAEGFVQSLNPADVEEQLPDFASAAVLQLCRAGDSDQMMAVIKGLGFSIVSAIESTCPPGVDVRAAIDVLAPHVFIRAGTPPPRRPRT